MAPIILLIIFAILIGFLKIRKIAIKKNENDKDKNFSDPSSANCKYIEEKKASSAESMFLSPQRHYFLILYFFVLLIAVFLTLHSRENAAEKLYEQAKALMDQENYESAIDYFSQLNDYEDSTTQIETARNYIIYNSAKKFLEEKEYGEAAQLFEGLGNFKDSKDLLNEAKYQCALVQFEYSDYEKAGFLFEQLGDYKNSKSYAARISLILHESKQETVYEEARNLYEQGIYDLALQEFEELGDYLDSEELAQKCSDALKRKRLATTISAGIRYSVGITERGNVISTGYNEDNQSNVFGWNNVVSVSAKGTITIGLRSDGKVLASHQRSDINVEDWENIIAVSAGERYIVVLRNDGTLDSQGHDMGDGQRNVGDWTDIVSIATGWRHTVALDKNGEIFITGYGDKSQLRQIKNNQNDPAKKWENIVAIAAGGGGSDDPGAGHTVGLRADGHVVAVGDNEYGQCDVESWEGIIAIAAGDWHTVGLCKDGTLRSTKPDQNKYPGLYLEACNVEGREGWTDIVEISAGCGTTIGLKKDGSIIALGYNDYGQSDEANKWENMLMPAQK